MIVLQIDFNKYDPKMLQLVADQVRATVQDEMVLVIPNDVNFIRNFTNEQIEIMIKILEKELEERKSNGL